MELKSSSELVLRGSLVCLASGKFRECIWMSGYVENCSNIPIVCLFWSLFMGEFYMGLMAVKLGSTREKHALFIENLRGIRVCDPCQNERICVNPKKVEKGNLLAKGEWAEICNPPLISCSAEGVLLWISDGPHSFWNFILFVPEFGKFVLSWDLILVAHVPTCYLYLGLHLEPLIIVA